MKPNATYASTTPLPPGPLARVRSLLSEWKRQYDGASLRRKLAADPENTGLLNQLGAFYELEGSRDKACAQFTALALIYRQRREVSDTAYYCRKLELLECPYRSKIYRELATLYGELGNYESAARACAQVVDLYIAEGHVTAAAGYIRALPQLGSIAASVRAELEIRVESSRKPVTAPLRPTVQRPPARHSLLDPSFGTPKPSGNGHRPPEVRRSSGNLPGQFKPVPPDQHAEALIDQVALAERSFEDLAEGLVSYGGEIFLSGTLGRITQFDIVQMVESNSLTGRLDISIQNELGVVFFDSGRIVAARFGLLEGTEAARRVFLIQEAPFRVVITTRLPPDEFRLATNTGFLLEILKTVDEEQADIVPPSSTDYSTSPLNDSLVSFFD